MAIISTCGPHCGIRANAEDTLTREGHCPCDELCHKGEPPPGAIGVRGENPRPSQPLTIDGQPLTGTPMCARWYEAAGDYRPWHSHPHIIHDAVLTGTVEIRPDAVPYAQTPPSERAG